MKSDVILLFVIAVIHHVWVLQVIPERTNVLWTNEKYVSDVKFYVKRYARRGLYYINLEGTTKHVWANNISAHLVFYEYLHNEYKRSFVEMHFKFCDLLRKDPYIGKALLATGITCPLPAGEHKLNNITVPTDHFPNVVPFEKFKVDINITLLPAEELIANIEIYANFKQKLG
ncbi:hypothetical protein MSG28_004818 [Choristoneura fumiferana]|uniref:Uncharacterized protein n=1 Tax=Choristoneura fumiferana TaxID=7141 RepID=A0ACC0K7I4_CHOFU|nr:hypothetical protein MSG28_004818 [Choristoneura fumiferana]